MPSTERRRSHNTSSSDVIGRDVTDEEIERYLRRVEEEQSQGFWNISTAAGLSLIVVGTAYLFQQLGFWDGAGLEILANMLPWLAGLLVILIGFGLLSRESSSGDQPRPAHGEPPSSGESEDYTPDAEHDLSIGQAAKNFVRAIRHTARDRQLIKSRDRKISGVCGGLGEYFGIDPTYVRLGFVIATVFGGGTPVILYVALMIAMPRPEDEEIDENTYVTVTRR